MATRKTRIAVSMILIVVMVSFFSFPMSAFASVVDPLIPGAVGSLINPGDVQIEKSAVATTGTTNEYLVTVKVSGKDKIESVKTDIVLVLDRSGSMGGQKIADVKSAAKIFVNKLLPTGNVKNQIGIVTFSDSANSNLALNPSGTAVGNAIDGISVATNNGRYTGGTYIQKALVQAKAMLNGSTATNKYIVLLSDGVPTYSTMGSSVETSSDIPGSLYKITAFNTNTKGSGSSYTLPDPVSSNHSTDAGRKYNLTTTTAPLTTYTVTNHGVPTVSQAWLIKSAGAEIFTIGFSLAAGNNATLADAKWVLQNIASGTDHYYDAANTTTLADAFAAITGTVTAAAKSAVVTDPMGDMVTYVPGSVFATAGTPDYDPDTKTITWTIGDVTESTSVTNPAMMTYRVTMNVTNPAFVTGTLYPLNGETTLSYIDLTEAPQEMTYLVPKAAATAKFEVTFVAGSNGSLVGTASFAGILDGTPWASAVETLPTPVPAEGYEFSGWTPVFPATVFESATYTAQFEAIPEGEFSLTTSVSGRGSIDPAEGTYTYEGTTTAAITYNAASRWRFVGWNDGPAYTVPDDDGNVLIDGNIKVQAIFERRVINRDPIIIVPETPVVPESPIIIPAPVVPAAPVVIEPTPVPAAPVLPKTGGFDASILYGLGALLASGGLVIRRRK